MEVEGGALLSVRRSGGGGDADATGGALRMRDIDSKVVVLTTHGDRDPLGTATLKFPTAQAANRAIRRAADGACETREKAQQFSAPPPPPARPVGGARAKRKYAWRLHLLNPTPPTL
jgi:hypothetical protein